jgi:hypothetical protein
MIANVGELGGAGNNQALLLDQATTRRSAGTLRRDGLRSGPLSVRSRRSEKEGRGIVPSVTSRSRLCREQLFPSKHLEATTRAAYRSYLDRHFLPFFGSRPMA